ncbi:DUF1833 family protein [Methylobacterium platani]|uniref:DUF1833 domain-containing protein n=2 Tax=Methylobacterium platani TaxID=427683 RepID=A0A179SHC3_9HYPH|nr:DUF1833 family protein [Methylobacterium platani]KMO20386.1 hypothetical protein SQ03_05730 [Methylobacterium platani JCM 14648]OAS26281.1 hypothetical protein A5481_06065 [Methylobacterium platani]
MPIAATRAWEEAAATIDTKERMLPTLEFLHSVFVEDGSPSPIRTVRNTEDMTFRLDGAAPLNPNEQVLFKAIPFGIDYPRIDKLGIEAPVWLDNVNREVARYLEAATKLNEPVIVIFRGYLLSDPDTVGFGPFRLQLRNVKRKSSRLEGALVIADPTKLRVMREIYDQVRFPALLAASGA